MRTDRAIDLPFGPLISKYLKHIKTRQSSGRDRNNLVFNLKFLPIKGKFEMLQDEYYQRRKEIENGG